MSTAYSSAKQQYIGNGVTTEWGFDFPIKKHSELKVYLKRSGLSQVLLEEGVDYSFVTENTIAFPIKTGEAKLQATDVLALQRESVFESEYNFSNQQRLEPEEVMHADDNLERQIQELKRDVTQAIRIQPTSNINTDEYFIAVESIYENLDKINNVSDHSSEIITCSNNIEAIQDAPNQANAAMNFKIEAEGNANDARNSKIEAQNSAVTAQLMATQAQDWAIKTDGKVDGTNYSSKYYAGQASNSANNSHIWAEGTDAQVRALGGVHSSKGWAEQSTNANIALTNSPYTTNRILEIPQDIKLELNNGTLTLKAGSKVYVPNGFESDGTTPKFDVVNVQSDISLQSYTGTYTECVVLKSDTLLDSSNITKCFSGNSVPSFTGSSVWYDTANNVCKRSEDSESTWETCSFPLCLCNVVSSLRTSIDQVFNGFGYIGSTVFALPGIKVQTPNGKNTDGTYRSVIRTVDSVKTYDANAWGTRNLNIIFDGSVSDVSFRGQPIERFTYNKRFSSDTSTYSYDENTGIWWYSSNQSSWIRFSNNIVGSCRVESGKITQFQVGTVDSVANSNASNFSQAGRSYLSGLGMPSSRYIDLTLGASDSKYTAPANGWFVLHCEVSGNNKYFTTREEVPDHGFCIPIYTGGGSIPVRTTVPCLAGKIFVVSYNCTINSTPIFRFIYAEGEN